MSKGHEGGMSSVEFAIVLPLLLVILFGIIEFSVAMFNQAVITNAAREGARAGIVYAGDDDDRPTEAQIRAVVNNYIGSHLISLGGASIEDDTVPPADISGAQGTAGQPLTVTQSFQYDFLVLRPLVALTGGALPGSITQTATSVMRLE